MLLYRFTVFASKHLPITITSVDDAEYVYNNLLGTNLFCVPQGGKERLSKWPEMKSKKLKICGSRPEQVAGDIVLSSAGNRLSVQSVWDHTNYLLFFYIIIPRKISY